MSDLVAAQFPLSNPLQALTGGLTNATQANIPAQTNSAGRRLPAEGEGAKRWPAERNFELAMGVSNAKACVTCTFVSSVTPPDLPVSSA